MTWFCNKQLWWLWVSFLEFSELGGQAEWGGFGVCVCVSRYPKTKCRTISQVWRLLAKLHLYPIFPSTLHEACGQWSGALTKREELSFLTVLALPKASRAGLAWMIWSSRVPCRGGRAQGFISRRWWGGWGWSGMDCWWVCSSRGPYSDLRKCVFCWEGLGYWAQGCCLHCSPGQGSGSPG